MENSRELGMVSEADAESLGKYSEKDRDQQAVESSNEVGVRSTGSSARSRRGPLADAAGS
jgi:hypothetical protein